MSEVVYIMQWWRWVSELLVIFEYFYCSKSIKLSHLLKDIVYKTWSWRLLSNQEKWSTTTSATLALKSPDSHSVTHSTPNLKTTSKTKTSSRAASRTVSTISTLHKSMIWAPAKRPSEKSSKISKCPASTSSLPPKSTRLPTPKETVLVRPTENTSNKASKNHCKDYRWTTSTSSTPISTITKLPWSKSAEVFMRSSNKARLSTGQQATGMLSACLKPWGSVKN